MSAVVRSAVRRHLVVAVACTLAACTLPACATPSRPHMSRLIDQQLITQDVIRGTNYTNLYDVVLALRSTWVRTRPSDSFIHASAVQVYLDTQRVGGLDELRTLTPMGVESVRYFDPIAASARWGLDHGAGVIYVVTARH